MATGFVNADGLRRLLDALNTEGEFTASVLTNDSGLPLAKASLTEKDLALSLAAMVPLVQTYVERTNQRIGLPVPFEVVVNNNDGSRLVIRFFVIGEKGYMLACLMPLKRQRYRRVMNKSVTAIKRLWAS